MQQDDRLLNWAELGIRTEHIYMAMSDRTYVSNTHAHVRMSV